jgi:predicted DNA-binding transcriptional regulator AlpA
VLGIPLDRLYKLLQIGTAPPHYKVGKSIYFRASDVLTNVSEQRAVCGGECGRTHLLS